MIKIKDTDKNKSKKQDPYYLLKFNYMIGDANGETCEKVKLSIKNPFIERFVTLLNGLKPIKGNWGIILEEYRLDEYYPGELSKEDYEFLKALMFENDDNTMIVDKENINYTYEFYDGVRGETEYSFLVFEGVDLYYYDEYGVKHETYFE